MGQLKNTVELIGFYGDDLTIACSAWTSTSRNLTEEKKKRVGKMINMLWSEGHETPFEKGVVHFLINVDQASHIHLLKHRISSFNGESARYKELKEDKYIIPDDWEGIEVSNWPKDMPMRYWTDVLKDYTEMGNGLYHKCIADLEPVLGRKRAKESARFFKTYNSQIQADIMFNMRSFANFIKLRNSEHAQLEIREIAQQMWDLVENIEGQPFKHTLEAINVRIQSKG
jgi:thymidylate synthase (FAD)